MSLFGGLVFNMCTYNFIYMMGYDHDHGRGVGGDPEPGTYICVFLFGGGF